MAMSPYRFAIKEPTAQGMKSRTGLAGVTTGGATSGGEGFRASALRPGSSGYMAAGFGAAPRTDYVKPVVETPAPPPAPPAPEPAPTLAPELADPSAGANARGGNVAEGDGANGGTGGLSGEIGAPNSGWLADLMANIGLTNPGYGYDGDYGPQLPGASTQPGGQADVDGEAAMGVGGYDGSYGPQLPGDWGGGTSGAASGGAPSGGGTTGGGQGAVDAEAMSGYGGGSTSGQGAVDAEAASSGANTGGAAQGSQSDADAAAEAASGGGGSMGGGGAQSDADAAAEAEASGGGGGMGDGPSGPDAAGVEGYAKGGFVKGKAPFPGKAPMPPRKPSPLAGVGTGGMGGYADGGFVDQPDYSGQPSRMRPSQSGGGAYVSRDPSDPSGQLVLPGFPAANNALNDAPVYSYPSASSARPEYDTRINNNNYSAAVAARVGEKHPGVMPSNPSPMEQLLASRPDLVAALLEQIGSAHPVNPGAPSTGNLGAYSQGGQVPNYADGGAVDGAALAGPDPAGPDDGFAALDGGEFVVQAQQAQRPDYGPILKQMNQGMYEPGEEMGEEGEEGMSTPGMVTDEGHTSGDPGALPPEQQAALMQAMQTDPMLAAALMQLLGPDAAHSMMDSTGGASPAPMATGRPPLAGPPPIPGAHAPPGVRPPAKAMPTQPMPPMPPRPMPGAGLGGVMA